MSTNYSVRFSLPDFIERGRSNTLTADIRLDGAVVTPTSGSVVIFDNNNESAASGTFTGAATFNYTPASTLDLGTNWRVEWTCLIGGQEFFFRNEAALVRAKLYSVVSDVDLFKRVSSLDPNATTALSSITDYQDFIDAAWLTINGRILSKGNRPNLIMSPASLREVHLLLTLSYIFEDFTSRLNNEYAETAMSYREQYQAEWGELRFEYDASDDGESDGKRIPLVSTYWI